MSRQPKTNTPANRHLIRISFLLDLKNNKELDFLGAMTGHGERPRELLRLAKLGLMREADDKKILDTVRAQRSAQPLIISNPVPPAQAPEEAVVHHAPESEAVNTIETTENVEAEATPSNGEASDVSEFTSPPSPTNSAADDSDDDRASPDTASAFLA